MKIDELVTPDLNANETPEEGMATEVGTAGKESETDYGEVIEQDLAELRESFPECRARLTGISELKDPMRFAALRDLGLSAKEAFLATGGVKRGYDNRAHLTSSVPAYAKAAQEMPRAEYEAARELFSDLTESEIRKLYRKVTK